MHIFIHWQIAVFVRVKPVLHRLKGQDFTLVLHSMSLPTPSSSGVHNVRLHHQGLTREPLRRIFNQLTTAVRHSRIFPAHKAGPWSYHYEQENFPAEQPPSREGARLPPAHAYPCRSRHPWCTPPQGPHRTLRVDLFRSRSAVRGQVGTGALSS